MNTKYFYKDGLWEVIANHPQYSLGQRELAALQRFLPAAAVNLPKGMDVLHLASATGREIATIVSAFTGIKSYLLNDIVCGVVEKSRLEAKARFSRINFLSSVDDIEAPHTIANLRRQLNRPTLIALTANSVIFSNRFMDSNILEAMAKGDLFLLTVEEPHDAMSESYLIQPVFQLLSESGLEVNSNNVLVAYDPENCCMTMRCSGKDLLVSYKPTPDKLRQRMNNVGFMEVTSAHYPDLHMLAGLYRKR